MGPCHGQIRRVSFNRDMRHFSRSYSSTLPPPVITASAPGGMKQKKQLICNLYRSTTHPFLHAPGGTKQNSNLSIIYTILPPIKFLHEGQNHRYEYLRMSRLPLSPLLFTFKLSVPQITNLTTILTLPSSQKIHHHKSPPSLSF